MKGLTCSLQYRNTEGVRREAVQWRLQPLGAALRGIHGPKRKMASVWLSAFIF